MHASLILLLKRPLTATSQQLLDQPSVSFPLGSNNLFIGHSFFVPIAEEFDLYAKKSGNYPNHNMQTFKRGGEKGSPIYLWDNHRTDIEAIFNSSSLAGSPIEFFGMTAGAPSDVDTPPTEGMLYLTRWIDLALAYNQNTSIYIGMPWQDFPADYSNATVYSSKIQENADYVWNAIKDLRGLYPDTNIFYFNYGSIVGAMRHLFEDDELVGVTNFIKPAGATKRTSLFSDTKGHSGTMMLNMMGLNYLQWFYGTPYHTLVGAAENTMGWNRQNVIDTFTTAFLANEDYRLLIEDIPTNSPVLPPTSNPTLSPTNTPPACAAKGEYCKKHKDCCKKKMLCLQAKM